MSDEAPPPPYDPSWAPPGGNEGGALGATPSANNTPPTAPPGGYNAPSAPPTADGEDVITEKTPLNSHSQHGPTKDGTVDYPLQPPPGGSPYPPPAPPGGSTNQHYPPPGTTYPPAASSQPQGYSSYPTPEQGYPPPGQGYPPQGQGYPSPGQGYPPTGQGYPPPGQGYPPAGQGYPPPGQGYPPPGQGYPPPGHGYPPPGQGYPPAGQGYPPPGQGYPPPGQGYPQAGPSYPAPTQQPTGPPVPVPMSNPNTTVAEQGDVEQFGGKDAIIFADDQIQRIAQLEEDHGESTVENNKCCEVTCAVLGYGGLATAIIILIISFMTVDGPSFTTKVCCGVFIPLCYIVVMVESCVSDTADFLGNPKSLEETQKFVQDRRKVAPVMKWKLEGYHNETHTRTKEVYRKGTYHTETESVTEKVVTYTETQYYRFSSCVDVSGELTDVSKSFITKVDIEKTFGFFDEESKNDYNFQKESFKGRHRHRDKHMDFTETRTYMKDSEEEEIERISVYPGDRPFYMSQAFFLVVSCLLCALPFRCFFRLASVHTRYTFVKLFKK